MASKKLKCAYIKWTDAWVVSGWREDPEQTLAKCFIHSVGVIIAEDDDSVVLCVSYGEDKGDFNATMHIPKAWVVKRKNFTMEMK